MIRQTRRGTAKHPSEGVLRLLERKPAKLAAAALANKIARIAWKLMVSGEGYAPGGKPAAELCGVAPAAA